MKKSFSFVLAALAVFFLVFTGCKIESSPSSKSVKKYNGTIYGKAFYSNTEDNSSIQITLDKTDGLRSAAVLESCGINDRSCYSIDGSSSDSRTVVSYTACDENGSYSFSNLEPGVYTVYALAKDSSERAVSRNISVVEDGKVLVPDLQLTATGSLSGKITVEGNESNNAGFVVFIAGTSYMAITGSNGSFTISDIPAGSGYEIVIMYGTYTYYWKNNVEVKPFVTTPVAEKVFTQDEYQTITNKQKGEDGKDGENGKDGEAGKDGTSIVWKGSFDSEDKLKNPQYLWAYFNTKDGCSYIYDGKEWTLLSYKGADTPVQPQYSIELETIEKGSEYPFGGIKIKVLLDGVVIDAQVIENKETSKAEFIGNYPDENEIKEQPSISSFYFNFIKNCTYVYSGKEWHPLGKEDTSYSWIGNYSSESEISEPFSGNIYYNTINHNYFIYNKSKWESIYDEFSDGVTVYINFGDLRTDIYYGISGAPFLESITPPELAEQFSYELNWENKIPKTYPSNDTTYTINYYGEVYNIIYKDCGNKNLSATFEADYPTTHTYGTKTELSYSLYKNDELMLEGFYLNPDGTGERITSLDPYEYTGDITLYAKYAFPEFETSIYSLASVLDECERYKKAIVKVILSEYEMSWEVNPYFCITSLLESHPDINIDLIIDEELVNNFHNLGFGGNFSNLKNLATITITNSHGIGYIFDGCTNLTSFAIENPIISIDAIPERAFYGCTSLTSVTIPDSVITIGAYAFCGCTSLRTITIPASVVYFGAEEIDEFGENILVPHENTVFEDCSDITINFEKTISEVSLEYIKHTYGSISVVVDNVLLYSKFCKSITIPDTVTSISNDAFTDSPELSSIKIGNVINHYDLSKIPNLQHVELSESVTSINDETFVGCSGLKSITIPSSVTSIGRDAFGYYGNSLKVNITDLGAWCNINFANSEANPLYYAEHLYLNDEEITSLQIPDTVTSIRNYAFYNCRNLSSIVIPSSVKSIGDSAFECCNCVTSVTIPSSVKSIGAYAFSGCDNLKSIIIENGVTSIGEGAFKDCSGLTSIKIPPSIISIGDDAFAECVNLEEVHITDLKSWCEIDFASELSNPLYCFCSYENHNILKETHLYLNGKDIVSLVIPDNVTSISNYAFCGHLLLTSVTIPSSVTSIGDYAFNQCYCLTSVTIQSGVTSIGRYAFCDCQNLISVTIPSSVTSIGAFAFGHCFSLSTMIFDDTTTWYRVGSSTNWNNKTGGTETDVSDPATNANNFTSLYSDYSGYYLYKL